MKTDLPLKRLAGAAALIVLIAGCRGSATTTARPTQFGATPSPAVASTQTLAPSAAATAAPTESGGTTTGGDIPDNAVFLTYHDQAHGFAIAYVEGWQVTPATDGVTIRDKDSSETVQVVAAPPDLASYITSTDIPALQSLPGFRLDRQDKVTINGQSIDHIVYHAPSPQDPVTGKEVASTIDRYYVMGANGLAIISLSTPDGVDNVDAFRMMIESFSWS